jgi:tripartite-type tricarboxylate transporter receptor subunit TctC
MAEVPALLLRGFYAALVSAIALLPTPGRAQSEFPSRPIKLVVPFPAGGGIDTTARVVGRRSAVCSASKSSCKTKAALAAPSRPTPW